MKNPIHITIIEEKTQKEHSHPEIELIYVLDGEAELSLEGEKYLLQKENIILINSARLHGWHVTKKNLICTIYIDYSFFAHNTGEHFITFWCNSLLNQDSDYDKMRKILQNIIREYSARNGKDTLLMQSLKLQLASYLLENFRVRINPMNFEVNDSRMEQALEYIEKNYNNKISLSEISDMLFVSESYFSRLFKKVTGKKFSEYVNLVRLNYAAESLLYGKDTITKIAVDCGFTTPSAFNKLFKSVYGCTPSQYQAHMKEKMVMINEEKQSTKNDKKLQKLLEQTEQKAACPEASLSPIRIVHHPIARYQKEGSYCINMGMMVDLLQAELRGHLKLLSEHCGFRYVRVQNVFYRLMYVYVRNSNKMNFFNIDNVLDCIIDSGMLPVIDLSPREKSAYFDIETNIFPNESDKADILNINQWEHILIHFMAHITERYKEQVLSWKFEFDYGDYQNRNQDILYNSETYGIFWKVTRNVIKSENPEYQIGGDGVSLSGDYDTFQKHLYYWKENNCMPDFLSIYGYPYSRNSRELYSDRETDPDFLSNGLKHLIKTFPDLKTEKYQLCFAEWNTSISERNYYNDSCAKSAHLVRQMIQFAGTGTWMCYNHGSDFLSQYYDTSAPFMGAIGLLNKNGIPKPAYYAFVFMNQLYPDILCKGDNYLVTSNVNYNYYILLCNPKQFNHNYYLKKEKDITIDDVNLLFENNHELRFQFVFEDVPYQEYRIKKYVLDENHGNVLNEWKDLNYTNDFSRSDIAYLKEICRPKIYYEDKRTEQNTLVIEETLSAHAIMLLHIYKKSG